LGTIREGFAIMKYVIFLTLSLFLFSAHAQSASSASASAEGVSETKLDQEPDMDFSNLKARIVPQIGMSSMGYTGSLSGTDGQGFSGGVTTELGETKARLLETGVLFLQNTSTAHIDNSNQTINTSEIALPLMGKLRFINLKSQQWYFKVGALTTFQTGTPAEHTSSMDVLASLGVGARVPVNRNMDFIIEATYNRGVLNAFFQDNSSQEGVLVFSGLSIGL
jgi:hypothetical protein